MNQPHTFFAKVTPVSAAEMITPSRPRSRDDKPRIIAASAVGPTASTFARGSGGGGIGGRGTREQFSLGELRFSSVCDKLYGRDAELASLRAEYDRVRGIVASEENTGERSSKESALSALGRGEGGGGRRSAVGARMRFTPPPPSDARLIRGGPSSSALLSDTSSESSWTEPRRLRAWVPRVGSVAIAEDGAYPSGVDVAAAATAAAAAVDGGDQISGLAHPPPTPTLRANTTDGITTAVFTRNRDSAVSSPLDAAPDEPAWNVPPDLRRAVTDGSGGALRIERNRNLDATSHRHRWRRRQGTGARLVLLGGYSGVGKSALARALRDEIDSRNRRLLRRARLAEEAAAAAAAAARGPLPPIDAEADAAPAPSTVEAFFVEGKFETQRRAVPYWAFSAAFEQLCEAIASLRADSPREFRELRECICSSVSVDAAYDVRDVMPGLVDLIRLDETNADVPAGVVFDDARRNFSITSNRASVTTRLGDVPFGEASSAVAKGRHKFRFVVRRLIRAVCTQSRPVVLFLDDLQWADASSLELLEALVIDKDVEGLLVIGSYRSNEVDNHEAHPLRARIREMKRFGDGTSRISMIRVHSLGLDAVNHFISDLLSLDPDQTLKLSTVVHKKTRGNIFFVMEFLVDMKEKGLLTFSIGILRWTWADPGDIESMSDASENVVHHLLKRRLRRNLSPEMRGALAAASCLGASFSALHVAVAVKALESDMGEGWCLFAADTPSTNEDACASGSSLLSNDVGDEYARPSGKTGAIDHFVTLGLIEPIRKSAKFRFVHDEVQSAAFSLVPESSRKKFQMLIGSALVKEYNSGDFESILFVAVDLYNCGSDYVQSQGEKTNLAHLNLMAAKKALDASSFSLAERYVAVGIGLLDQRTCWTDHYHLSISLHKIAVEVEYCTGNLDKMKEYAGRITSRAEIPFQDKIEVYIILVDSLGSQERPSDAIKLGDYVLRKSGVNIVPRWGLKFHKMVALAKTRHLLKGYTRESLISLPPIKETRIIDILALIDVMSESAYIARRDLSPVLRFKSVRWSVRHGSSSHSPLALISYAAVLCSYLGDFKEAQFYRELAETLSEKYRDTFSRTWLINIAFVFHWVKPLHLCLKPALKGYQIGMETGSLSSAMHCCNIFCHYAMWTGKPLSLVNADFQAYVEQTMEYKLDVHTRAMLPCWQTVHNLMMMTEDPTSLVGEVMDENELMQVTGSEVNQLRQYINFSKMWLLYYFGEYEMAWKLIKGSSDFDKVCAGKHAICRRCFCVGLVAFALAHKKGKAKWKRRAVRAMNRISGWCKAGNVNCVHMLQLLQAEKEALSADKNEALKKYNQAINTAGRHGFPQDRALANERAGLFFLSIRDDYWASHYLREARLGYIDWEAFAKVSDINKKHSRLLPAPEIGELRIGDALVSNSFSI